MGSKQLATHQEETWVYTGGKHPADICCHGQLHTQLGPVLWWFQRGQAFWHIHQPHLCAAVCRNYIFSVSDAFPMKHREGSYVMHISTWTFTQMGSYFMCRFQSREKDEHANGRVRYNSVWITTFLCTRSVTVRRQGGSSIPTSGSASRTCPVIYTLWPSNDNKLLALHTHMAWQCIGLVEQQNNVTSRTRCLQCGE